ncbi:GNAT superfamily N-acetyltransferase [Sedimentibacter acidaminivorans]|uniref:GNAT superfamily N-acetyltransferase n=1 Tax=Sedimentibacter acidaminivorans TaxID=913099 RepID=A0ABS4GD60_9FIRM|nr:N-acetyltransferase [Sedimentibacter acidaminivorans]MBP1925631.1 GNAT superfamily N-acetyltransferase [Sedimentibacter acidaminivorans]
MIRKFNIDELETVMKIWLETNIVAHVFISEDYWQGNYEQVKMMLPDATVFVYEENNLILGFIGLTENYIAGIFIDTNSQSKGIGKVLLDYVKKCHSELLLQVYKKNSRAVRFYLREGFVVSNEQIDKNTGEAELVMNWTK